MPELDRFETDPDFRVWPESDGITVLGTPLGTPGFVQDFLEDKLKTQNSLTEFITEVARMGHSREATAMLLGAAIPRQSHVLKTMAKDETSLQWMREMDALHVETWLGCLGGHNLPQALSAMDRWDLTETLDLPTHLGGEGLRSLERSADSKLLGSWA